MLCPGRFILVESVAEEPAVPSSPLAVLMKFDVTFIEGDEKLSSAIFFRALRGFGDESCFMDIRF